MTGDIRRLYKKTSTREKFLLLLFTGGIAFLWLSYSYTRYTDGFRLLKLTRNTIDTHRQFLALEDYVTSQLVEKSSELDASKTLSSTELVRRVSQLIEPLKLERYSINSPQSEEGTLFTFHTLRLNVNKAELESVLKLSDSLKTLVPYVTVERVVVSADRSNQTVLDIQFFICSIEMNAS